MILIKKVFILFMALLIFAMPFHEEVRAVAVASKVVNASAKKMAKETIKDTAVQMSMEMVLDYKYEPKDSRVPKEGYSFICLPKDKNLDGSCANVVEMKQTLSETDKQSLSTRVENNLDRKIAGGIGATKWGKFLDWLVPVFGIGLGVAVIDYAIHGDVSDLFDELAWDSLADLGLVVVPGADDYETLTGLNHSTVIKEVVTLSDGRIRTTYRVSQGTEFEIKYKSYMGGDTRRTASNIEVHVYPNGDVTAEECSKYGECHTIELNQTKVFTSKDYTKPVGEVKTLPKWDSLALPRTNKANEPMKIVAPGSIPFTEKETGEELLPYPKPDGTTGFKTRVGTEVPEDNVNVGNPKVTENPDGSKTVVKAPTVATPSPSPSENGTIPKAPVKDETITEEELGNSCARLKKPDFEPLTSAITTSFPFSIPWDLHNAFQNAFSGIGDDRPEFEYKGSYNGKTFEWKIEFPKFFDSWMPFIRGLMILTFDVGLLYAIYRFTKGGGD